MPKLKIEVIDKSLEGQTIITIDGVKKVEGGQIEVNEDKALQMVDGTGFKYVDKKLQKNFDKELEEKNKKLQAELDEANKIADNDADTKIDPDEMEEIEKLNAELTKTINEMDRKTLIEYAKENDVKPVENDEGKIRYKKLRKDLIKKIVENKVK